MSDFGKAFRREVGKNTGKFISNVIFGDKHSTPYRRVDAARRERQANINARHADQMQIQQERLRVQQERLRIEQARRSKKYELQERQVRIQENETRERRTNQLYAVDSAVNAAIDNLLSSSIPTDILRLEQYILDLQVQLNASKSDGFSDERNIRKKYVIALRERFFQAFNKLEILSPDSYVIDDCIAAYEDLQYEKYCESDATFNESDKFARLFYILKRNIPSTKQRIEKELETLIFFTQKYEWRGGFRNRLQKEALRRAKMDSERLSELDPDNLVIDIIKDHEQALRELKRKKRFMILTGAAVVIFVILCIICGKLFFWSCVIIGCLIPIIYYSVKYYHRNSHKIKSIIKTDKENIEVEQCQDDIFIDLNQHNRISDALKHIWDRYKDSIPDTIFNRSPIFAADGVKNSILFVGVNPSYNESDDDVLIGSDDHRSLLYGSFYKRSDAPEYFKTLEEFASKLGFAYSQMNLLYLRENDRNLLAQLNSEFIREQLELTYDTIQCLQPVTIIFMSDWCRQLIDGPGRWVDSKKGQPDNLTLNGTNIPIFFSDDISILNNDEKIALSRRIKIRLMP